jgi:predicted membrane protein
MIFITLLLNFFLFGFIYGLKYLFLNRIRKIGRERKSHIDTSDLRLQWLEEIHVRQQVVDLIPPWP